MQDQYENIISKADSLLIVVAHPDDLDVMAGGTIARARSQSIPVRALVCTNGAFGSRENDIPLEKLARMRLEEQRNAVRHLGMDTDELFILDNEDCTLRDTDHALIERIAFHMREFRPSHIITHDPITIFKKQRKQFHFINHRDHRAVGGAVVNAVMPMARDVSFFPEHRKKGLTGIDVKKILVHDSYDGEIFINIDDFIAQKIEALLSHSSQFDDMTVKRIMMMNDANAEKDTEETDYWERFRYYELER
ncbi:PIG-L family deacetylase [Candidatus Dojkabacteria bacterium]|uniref:PIG-L family deacetylase n=1 Tax=Candidatus Dojkabacteria bacterium TaxID=2099670 RepID=A0A955L7N0_9BACT|nr:PIG-L family deacetylase [Candidatus Dojkabacteria bacterium]